GPGYGMFLAAVFRICGIYAVPVLLVQILLSGISCLLLYLLAWLLIQSRAIAILAGVLGAASYTSISLSCLVLSDTWYFFLFLISIILFLRGLECGQWKYFVMTGIIMAGAILTRAIGQFWPIIMVVLAALYRPASTEQTPSSLTLARWRIAKTMLSIAIVAVITLSWVARNYSLYGLPLLTQASSWGPAKVAAMTLGRLHNSSERESLSKWRQSYEQKHLGEEWTPVTTHHMHLALTDSVLSTYPVEMVSTYLSVAWRNVTDINYLHRVNLPDFNSTLIPWEHRVKQWGLNYLNFIVSMIGLVILGVRRNWRACLVLGVIFFYYAAMVGASQWQGSRLFFPGQIAAAILIAVVIVTFLKAGRVLLMRVRQMIQPSYSDE
ncbi:MAG: glycosyltransferase family 39 protein, partial [Candidatus Zixiibacteriota bacterium]